VRLVLALLVAAALAVFVGDGYLGVNLPWVLLAAAAVEAVHLVRSRAVGWTAATQAEPPTRPYRLRP
jgi:hypothetical protein